MAYLYYLFINNLQLCRAALQIKPFTNSHIKLLRTIPSRVNCKYNKLFKDNKTYTESERKQ